MNETLLTILIIAIAAGAVVLGLYMRDRAKRKAVKTVVDALPVRLPATFEYIHDGRNQNEPLIQSVVPVPTDAINAISEGIWTQIARTQAAYPLWPFKKLASDYIVCLIDPDARNIDGSPALMIRGIQSAGTVIGVGDDGFSPSIIILPHQAATDWQYLDYLENSARHESEHDREWANDRDVFWSFIGTGDVHPHFP